MHGASRHHVDFNRLYMKSQSERFDFTYQVDATKFEVNVTELVVTRFVFSKTR